MTLRARWHGPAPRVGDYFASPTRPRFAYRVTGVHCVDSIVRWNAAQKAELRQLKLDVDRVPITALPPTARVHPWRWDKRGGKPVSRT
jgi:hypothetical protein